LIFHVFGALAEFERDLIRERTIAGLAAARARGRLGGRPKGFDEKKARLAQALRDEGSRSVKEICDALKMSPASFYRYTKQRDEG
jgi:DNA invertase Pin-like site-specific DNA recombinase